MATSARSRRPLLLAALAIVAFHAAVVLAISAMTRPRPAGSPSEGVSPAASAADPLPPAWPVPDGAPAGAAAAALALPPEILSAPASVRGEPIVPLPADPEDRADSLAALRNRRLADMLERRAGRAAGPRSPADAAR